MKGAAIPRSAKGALRVAGAYLFEAKGIQRWVMAGGRLRDIAAASALLARCARADDQDLLGEVIAVSRLTGEFSRRAGGAFQLCFEDAQKPAFDRFRALWRLAFMQALPGLEFVEALVTDQAGKHEAMQALRNPQARQSAERENSPASLIPLGSPLARTAPRTGAPAVEIWRPDGQPVDRGLRAKRRADGFRDDVAKALADPPRDVSWTWPNRMEDDGETDGVTFPFAGTDGWIAVVHADISALGAIYRSVGDAAARSSDPAGVARGASDAIEAAVAKAARAAMKAEVAADEEGVMPARPILLGGDDITLILRGDVAIPFTSAFLKELETASRVELERFANEKGLDVSSDIVRTLTAAAGVAFGGPKQPFFRLLELAVDLCGYAKARAKATVAGVTLAGDQRSPPSALAFHRVTESALSADAGALIGRLRAEDWGTLTRQPYLTGDLPLEGLARLADLKALRDALDAEGLKAGALRGIRSLMMQEDKKAVAQESWRRWREMAQKRAGGNLAEFDRSLAILLGSGERGSLSELREVFDSDDPTSARTPLFDALEWRAVR